MMVAKSMKKSILSIVVSSVIVTTTANNVFAADAQTNANDIANLQLQVGSVDTKSVQHERRITALEQTTNMVSGVQIMAQDALNASQKLETRMTAAEADVQTAQGDAIAAKNAANQLSSDMQNVQNQVADLDKDKVAKTDFDTYKTDTQTKLDDKASKTDLDQQKADLTDAIKAETQRAKAAEAGIATNTQAIAGKVDQTTYSADHTAIANSLQTVDSKASKAKDAADQNTKDIAAVKTVSDRADSQSQQNLGSIDKEIQERQLADSQHDLGIKKNAQDIAGKVDKTTYSTDKAAQATKDKVQDTKLDGLRQKNTTQDAAIAANTNGIATNKQAAADATTLATQALNATAKKVDQTAYDADKSAQQKKDSDQNIKIAGNGSAIASVKQTISTLATSSQLNAEKVRATAAEKKNADIISAETTRATGAEQKLTQDKADKTYVDGQISLRDKGIQSNTNNITQMKKDVTAAQSTATAATAAVAQEAKDRAANDKVLADRTTTNANAIKAEAKTRETADKALAGTVATETARATSAESALEQKKADKSQIAAVQTVATANANGVKTNTQTETKHFVTLAQGVMQNHSDNTAAQKLAVASQTRADAAYAYADANRHSLDRTNKTVANHSKELANHEQRISDLESNNQTNFNKLESQQNKDRKEFRAGIAGAIALGSIPQAPQDHTAGIGMGVGTFNGESAISAGVSARVTNNITAKTGLSWDTEGNIGAGAGFLVSY